MGLGAFIFRVLKGFHRWKLGVHERTCSGHSHGPDAKLRCARKASQPSPVSPSPE